MERVGLIAGNGKLPLLFASTARTEGIEVVAAAHVGECLPEIEGLIDDLTWVKVGQLDRIIETFKDRGIDRAVMAGGINKASLLDNFDPDERAQQMLGKLTAWGDDAILRGVAGELEAEGIAVVESTIFLQRILTAVGPISGAPLDEAQQSDVVLGVAVAKAVGQWDVGQSVAVKSGMVLAVEAIEGTDATIDRIPTEGAVLVKVSKPSQDMRFDVPAVGPETVERCAHKGVAVLALEAGKTLILDKEQALERAVETGLKIVGVDTTGES